MSIPGRSQSDTPMANHGGLESTLVESTGLSSSQLPSEGALLATQFSVDYSFGILFRPGFAKTGPEHVSLKGRKPLRPSLRPDTPT